MIHEVTMPAMGADMTEGTVVKWLKSEGDDVARGDKLAEIETDKTVVEMEAYNAGILRKIVLGDGTKAPVGSLLAYIGGVDDVLPTIDSAPEAAVESVSEPEPEIEVEVPSAEVAPQPEPAAPAPTPVVSAPAAPTVEGGRIKASPLARRLAQEKGYDLAAIPATGPGGRITRDDVLDFTPAPAFAPSGVAVSAPSVSVDGSDIELTTMRQAIARVTVRSKTEAPHYYVTSGVDMTEAMSFRAQLNAELAESGVRVSVNDMIIKALTMAIVKYPKWNTTFHEDRLEGHASINIGVAIALEAGLIVPALIGVQSMSLVDVANASKDLGARARGEGGSLTQEELTAGTFSTSNLGMFGTDTFAAIIVPPQAGILAVGAVKPTPVVLDDEIVVRQMMNATISADHRVGDGAEAAILLNEVKDNLERPLRLIL
ncbi:MAG: dihydrolipoamide acetyltransferase family protein [Chloroflexi bacterium]|nr:dihydrolipoamide acetyltransferase family protein [Chloroflexota bacterium]